MIPGRLGKRPFKALQRHGLAMTAPSVIADVLSQRDVLMAKGGGRRTLREIREYLAGHGLDLRGPSW
mgnify:CR=1 FL=1